MTDSRLYYNPECSKSRAAASLLADRGIVFQEVRYLDSRPSADELRSLVSLLGGDPRMLIRSSEPEYLELGLDARDLAPDALIEAMVRYPSLIERPVFVHGERAVVGRPPERVLELLDA